MNEQNIDRLAKMIWDYMLMHHELNNADALLVLCSHDTRVADYAVELFLKGYAPMIIFSGTSDHHNTRGDLLATPWGKSEADVFADIALRRGVPKERVLIERTSTNTGENIAFTKQLLHEHHINLASCIVVQKPYMERRAFATFKKMWSEIKFIVTSPPIAFEHYPTNDISKEAVINIMVGDLERIKHYPTRGFQIPQEIPNDVWQSYEKLVALGYNKHLIND